MLVHRDDVVRAIGFAVDHRLSGLYNLFNDIPENKADFLPGLPNARDLSR